MPKYNVTVTIDAPDMQMIMIRVHNWLDRYDSGSPDGVSYISIEEEVSE